MTIKLIDRLLFAQGGRCFFCQCLLTPGEASVEHLVASSNGGSNNPNNCVVCCKALNALMGNMSLKEKLQVVLNQQGRFQCPNGKAITSKQTNSETAPDPISRLSLVIADLLKRGKSLPRTIKSLSGTINALFKKNIREDEISSLLEELQAQGIISLTGTRVTYVLPAIGEGRT